MNIKCINSLKGHKGSIWQLCYSPYGTLIASCGNDKTVKIWQNKFNQWELVQVLSNHSRTVRCVSFSKSGSYLACGSFDSTVTIYFYDSENSKFVLVIFKINFK